MDRSYKGVAMFRSDLVYLRANVKALTAILAAERTRGGSAKVRALVE